MNFCPDCGKPNPSDLHTCSPQVNVKAKLDPVRYLEDQLDHMHDVMTMLRRRIEYIERQLEEHFNA